MVVWAFSSLAYGQPERDLAPAAATGPNDARARAVPWSGLMASVQRAALVVLMSTALLPQCTPDFESLTAGATSGGAGNGNAGGGQASNAGSENPGIAGASSGAGQLGGGAAGEGGEAGVSMNGGAGAGATPGDGGAGGDAGGAGGEPGCAPPRTGLTTYMSFDHGIEGGGFLEASSKGEVATTKGATALSLWDPDAGSSCLGALRFSFSFKEYVSGSAADERGFGTYQFKSMNWSDTAALHTTIKVSPANAPITGVRFFVMSGAYLFYSSFDGSQFKSGEWQEVVLEPVSGDSYDPTNVFRLGIQVDLVRAGAPGIPATPPTIDIWLDDVWLEPK